MSGIYAVTSSTVTLVQRDRCRAIHDVMRYRGVVIEQRAPSDRCVLGRLLPIVRHRPHDTGRPATLDDDLVCVADARLDERHVLGRALGLDGPAVAAASDTALILRAYVRWGVHAFERLLGGFAVAVWDGRRDALVLARDHIGLRPLHFARGAGVVVAASDAAAAKVGAGLGDDIDEEVLVAMLVSASQPLLERSVWRGVFKVPPGHVLTLRLGAEPETHVHWQPGPRPAPAPREHEDHARELLKLVDRAVVDAVRGERRVAAHVSGGLDSSSIALLAHRALQPQGLVRGLCWAPPPPLDPTELADDDDRRRVLALAEQLGIDVAFTPFGDESRRVEARRIASLEPSNMLLLHSHGLQHSADGIDVILSGWGGDEVASFNGRNHLAELVRRGRLIELRRSLADQLRRSGHASIKGAVHLLLVRALLPQLPAAGQLLWGWHQLRQIGFAPARPGARARDVHPSARRLQLERFRVDQVRPQGDPMRVALLRHGHLTARIESWELAGARLGVEHRYPLLDRRVLDHCLALPDSLWIVDGWPRWIYRQAFSGLLSDELIWGRPKGEPSLARQYVEMLRPSLDSFAAPAPAAQPIISAWTRHQAAVADDFMSKNPELVA